MSFTRSLTVAYSRNKKLKTEKAEHKFLKKFILTRAVNKLTELRVLLLR